MWNQLGPLVAHGDLLLRLSLAGAIEGNDISAVNIRLYHQTGPWEGTWDTNAETTRTLLISANNVDFSGADMKRHKFNIDQTAVGDGMLLLFIQPTNVPAATRYLNFSGAIEWEPA